MPGIHVFPAPPQIVGHDMRADFLQLQALVPGPIIGILVVDEFELTRHYQGPLGTLLLV